MVRIFHYREKCIGCNACVEAAFDRWRMSKKDGRCTLIGGKENKGVYMVVVGDEEKEANQLAAKNCPVRIIQVEDC